MRWPLWFVPAQWVLPVMMRRGLPWVGMALVLMALPDPGLADTLFDKREKGQTIQEFHAYLESVRSQLFAPDEDDREDAFERIEESLENPPLTGDAIFALALLGDVLVDAGRPPGGKDDRGLREDAAELLTETALDSSLVISRREAALAQLLRVVRAKRIPNFQIRDDIFNSLATLSEDSRPVIAHGAIIALTIVAGISGKTWGMFTAPTVDLLQDRMSGSDLEMRRNAILEVVYILEKTDLPSEISQVLWEELAENLDDIESPTLQNDLRPHLKRLLDKHKSSPFTSQAEEVREELEDFSAKADPAEGKLPELFEQLTEEDDLEDLESLLARLEAVARQEPTLRAIVTTALMTKASDIRIDPYFLRITLDSLARLGRVPGSAMMYYRTANQLLDLAFIHRSSGKAHFPLTQLARLLASTDKPGLVLPVLENIKYLAAARNQPVWVGRRLVALLYLQSGDSPNEEIRAHALKLLREMGASARNWAIRAEVHIRMGQLSRFARDAGIKAKAADWLKG